MTTTLLSCEKNENMQIDDDNDKIQGIKKHGRTMIKDVECSFFTKWAIVEETPKGKSNSKIMKYYLKDRENNKPFK